MDPTISYDDLAVIRDIWPGKIVVKGVQNVEDSVRLIDAGVDGIILSNHGGRQLDRAPIPFHLLPKVVREVGKDATVMVDTGIMNGADIVASIALGAKFTLIGRAYLYGLMAGGREGVDRTIAILRDEIERTMKLLGVSSLAELEPQARDPARRGSCRSPAAPRVRRARRARASREGLTDRLRARGQLRAGRVGRSASRYSAVSSQPSTAWHGTPIASTG